MTEEVLKIITKHPGITYSDLLYRVKSSTSGLWWELKRMEKEGLIKSVGKPGRKAKGWVKA